MSYLYNDGKPEELAAIAAHVQECEPCTLELAALGDTREQLAGWAPPNSELGFSLPGDTAVAEALTASWQPSSQSPSPISQTSNHSTNLVTNPVASTVWWRQAAPAWMQAVAAMLVFGAGLAVGTAGRAVAPAPAVATTTPAPPGAAPVSRSELADLQQWVRGELARVASTAPAAVPVQAAAQTSLQTSSVTRDEALLRRMSTLIGDSEERQRRELAMRTAQVLRDFEIQRKVDLATMQQAVGQIQSATGGELLQQRELYKRLMDNVSQRQGAP